MIYPALTEHNLDLPQKICDYEEVLDEYKESHELIKSKLQSKKNAATCWRCSTSCATWSVPETAS